MDSEGCISGCEVITVGIVLIAGIYALVGYVVALLYNYIVVSNLALSNTEMTFPVGVAVLVLCSILFKSSSSSSSSK